MKKLILFLGLVSLLAVGAQATIPDVLDAWYASNNHMYFQDQLPKNVIINRNLHNDQFMAVTIASGDYFEIEFNPVYNVSEKHQQENLLHEQCHILIYVEEGEKEFEQHGPKWQACMHRLANAGAFESLW